MSVLDLARIIIYRFHEKGLEIFLINSEIKQDNDIWKHGRTIKTFAIEGDWHDIPSIRGMLKHDVKLVKSIVKENLPGSEKGAYFAIKEAVRKVMPQEYKAIKELKEILFDRNSVTNI